MNLLNLFEDDNSTPGSNYAEELAYQIFKAAPELDTTGAADEVLDHAFDLAVHDLGRKRAHSLFAYDADFDGDLVTAYAHLQRQGVAEADPHKFDSDVDYYAAQNAPAKRRSAPSDYPYSKEEDDDYFREIFRKKREAAAKVAQDKESGMAEGARERLSNKHDKIRKQAGLPDPKEYEKIIRQMKKEIADLKAQKQQGMSESQMSELNIEYEDYKKLSPREFFNMYRITKQAWLAKYKNMLPQQGMSEELAMQHQRDLKTQKFPDTSNSLAKRTVSLAAVPNVTKSADGYPTVRGRADSTQRTAQTRVDPTITTTTVKRKDDARPIPSFLQKGVAEADKKKDDAEPEVRDVALQRAISRAKSDFPTAGSGIEALAKDFIRSQDQDSKSFDQLRQVERKQDQMLGQITKIDQEQEQEIQALDSQNNTMAQRLQQLQSVNSNLEKKLAAMSGRKADKKSGAADVAVAPAPVATKTEPTAPKTKAKVKSQPAKSSMKSTAKQLAAPKEDPIAAMTNRITKGDSSVIDRVSGQSSLPFDPLDNVLEPMIPQQQNPRFAAARRDADDAELKRYSDLTSKIAKSAMQDPGQAQLAYRVREGDNEEQEFKYSNKYQDMVARVGQKAREQEKSKPVDIANLARRLAAIEASRKDK